MIERYSRKKLKTIWEDYNKYSIWLDIELAAAEAMVKLGKSPTIACFGLAFKPNVDDLRTSPALRVTMELQSQGYEVIAVEPNIGFHDVLKLVGVEKGLEADVIVILVRHRQFLKPDIQELLELKNVLDFCGSLYQE